MKKGVIAVIILLALLVIVSPGLIGKLAEQQVDENLNRAVDHSAELVVTSDGFKRGWFSSEGEHRITIGEGGLREALANVSGGDADLPVLVISTRMDHGLIPVTSMSREKGSLAPGLGNAVSTMRVEFGDGETFDVPGTLFSKVALNGDLVSQYLLEEGSQDTGEGTLSWKEATIDVTADASTKGYAFDGTIGGVTMSGDGSVMTVGPITMKGDQEPSEFGFFIGDVNIEMDSVGVTAGGVSAVDMKGMKISGKTDLDDDRALSDFSMSLDSVQVPSFGEVAVLLRGDSSANAEALGKLITALEQMSDAADPMQTMGSVQAQAKDLFAGGFDLNLPQFDVSLPMGKVETALAFSVPQADAASFEWTSLLLTTQANLDVRVPAELITMATSMNPQAGALVAAGYLQRDGDYYVMDADMEKGLLTINGAPIPLPLGF